MNIFEYKKMIELIMITGNDLPAPPLSQERFHHVMTFTKEYCGEILNRERLYGFGGYIIMVDGMTAEEKIAKMRNLVLAGEYEQAMNL
jgi:hypothetical protein